MGGHRSFERDSGRDLDAGAGQAIKFGRIISEQEDPGAVQLLEHQRSNAIVAFVVIKAEGRIGIAGIESTILQLVGSHLVGETEAPALLSQVQDHAAAEAFELVQRKSKLVAAIASSRAEDVSGQAGRVE